MARDHPARRAARPERPAHLIFRRRLEGAPADMAGEVIRLGGLLRRGEADGLGQLRGIEADRLERGRGPGGGMGGG